MLSFHKYKSEIDGYIHFMSKQIFYFDLFIGSFREFLFERLSLSLFMSRVGTNYYNSSSPTDQSTFFTNFTNGGPDFHSCYSLTEFRMYLFSSRQILLEVSTNVGGVISVSNSDSRKITIYNTKFLRRFLLVEPLGLSLYPEK